MAVEYLKNTYERMTNVDRKTDVNFVVVLVCMVLGLTL